MKATLEFDLTDIDDKMAHLRCVKATDMALALWEIRCNLRKRCEHIIDNMNQPESETESMKYDVLEVVLTQIGEIMEDYDINPDEYIN